MNTMLIRTLLILLLSWVACWANAYKDSISVELKKDEHKEILVKYGQSQRLFKFRWTLYTNGGLVIFRSYDKIVAQNVLYLRHMNQSFRMELRTRGASNYKPPYLLVKFYEFDEKEQIAKFQVFLSDKNSEIRLEYLKNK